MGDLLAALGANADFDARFSAGFTSCTTGRAATALGVVTAGSPAPRNVEAVSADTGRTQFAIEVRFNAYVSTVDHDELLEDLLFAAAHRAGAANTDAGIRAAVAGGTVADDGTVTAGTAGGGLGLVSSDQTAVSGPVQVVRYEGETALAANLPMARDLVNTAAGAAELADDPNTDATETAFRPAVAAIATGYAADVTSSTARARTDDSMNAGSQRRIAVTSSVKARN